MHRSARIAATAIATGAVLTLLASQIGQVAPAVLATAAGLTLLATATTVHAILRPAQRRPVDEAYVRSFDRVSARLDRMR
ncbi:hypothetical protein FXF51_01645 [Nonomuraea sp. PA05]|uniref:hypothetical protein n=1 Tax=Nonomuraea sp. PA05 TaxID=2604466 RepID=UPI0011D8969B|nr:hypothetical protein [Nonomuraea sp. PA05]TYB71165.1 hypothetical protein FXF51_01645 [Nonomuraea sp. PA05]